MKKILLTGAAGFIASNLCEALLSMELEVDGLDNFSDYYSVEEKKKNLSSIKNKLLRSESRAAFRFFEADIRNIEALEEIFSKNSYDIVLHLAASAGVRSSIENAAEYMDTNVLGTVNVLEMMRIFGVKNFVFASSSSVYGERNVMPFFETDCCDKPLSPYAASKRAGEIISYTYASLHEINVACLRLFSVYGPRQRPDLALSKFVDAMKNGQEIVLYGDGNTARDYSYVSDIVDGIIRSAFWLPEQKPSTYEIFNLGRSEPVKLIDFITVLEKATGKKAKTRFEKRNAADVSLTCANIDKARAVLGYCPSVSLFEGVENYLNWIGNHC